MLFGPIVGYKLKDLFDDKNIEIIGDLNNPVCHNNIYSAINYIRKKHTNPFIIAIDSALSAKEHVGKIVVSEGGLCIGRGVGRNRMIVGDMSIRNNVEKNMGNSRHNLRMLQNTNLGIVMQMAQTVAIGIYSSIECEN